MWAHSCPVPSRTQSESFSCHIPDIGCYSGDSCQNLVKVRKRWDHLLSMKRRPSGHFDGYGVAQRQTNLQKDSLLDIAHAMRTFCKSQFSSCMREACRVDRAVPGTEICGLVVDTGFYLSLVQARNVSRRSGSFIFSRPDVRRIVAAAEILGQEVVGTFHSHPAAPAIPSASDIANAVDDSLMLIFDCVARCGRLWRIRSGRARELSFTTRLNVVQRTRQGRRGCSRRVPSVGSLSLGR